MAPKAAAHTERQKELGQFLRSRRERLKPDTAQLSRHPRRRTPGWRREELAEEAGVGVTWYTWLEQGRDIRASPEAMRRICRALHLDKEETRYAFGLAGLGLVQEPMTITKSVPRALQRVLDNMDYIAAYVHNARWDRIAWNDAALALMGDFKNGPPEHRNTVWRTFANPEVRAYTVNWRKVARIVIAEFHASMSQEFEHPWLAEFVARLSRESPEFREWWPEREVMSRKGGKTSLRNPEVGVLHLERSIFQVPYDPGLSLVMFTPVPKDESPERMRKAVDAFRSRRKNSRAQ